jgi:ATP-dependent Lhr-like helicase
MTTGEQVIQQWYRQKKWEQFAFQQEMMEAYLGGYSGFVYL